MHPNDFTLLDFKTIVSICLIGRYTSRSRDHQMAKQVPKENISIRVSKVVYHHIFQSLKRFEDDGNVTAKKELT